MYNPRRIAATGAFVVGVFAYGLGLRFVDEADPTGPVLWVAAVVAVVTFVFLVTRLSFDLDPDADEEG